MWLVQSAWLRNERVVCAYTYLHILPPQIPSYPQTHTDTWNYDQGSAKCTLNFGVAATIVEFGFKQEWEKSSKNGIQPSLIF